MALITYILIAIPVCLLAIILAIFQLAIKRIILYPDTFLSDIVVYAQHTDKVQYKISFSSHETSRVKLEYTQDGIILPFYAESNAAGNNHQKY